MEKLISIESKPVKTSACNEEVYPKQSKLIQILLSMPQTLCEVEKRYLEKQMQHGKTIHLGNFSGNKKNILKMKIQKMECSSEAMKKRNNTRTKHVSNSMQQISKILKKDDA